MNEYLDCPQAALGLWHAALLAVSKRKLLTTEWRKTFYIRYKHEILPVKNVCLYGLKGKKYFIFQKSPIICMTMSMGGWKLVLNVNENFIHKKALLK